MSSTQQLLLGEGAGGGAVAATYIEDVFSTWLYTGNGASGQSIVNGIDLSTKGGLVWLKSRTTPSGSSDNNLYDTARGASQLLISNTTAGNTTATRLSFQTTGFNLTNEASSTNESGVGYVSWTFREQPKFFDIVTYTGDGTGGSRQVAHNLGSTPGCVLIKRTDASGNWMGFHRNTGATNSAIAELSLNLSTAPVSGAAFSQSLVTSTYFVAGDIQSADGGVSANANGATYVAYLFAHNAGGFGLTGTDNVISCESFATDGSGNATVSLGYEPQWILFKTSTTSDDWRIFDVTRGLCVKYAFQLNPNTTNEEANIGSDGIFPTATGFVTTGYFSASQTVIYVAIRRGPMKVPTDATKVFAPVAYTGTNLDNRLVNTGILTDMTMARISSATSAGGFYTADRLRGNASLGTASTGLENTDADSFMTPTVGYGGPFSAMNGFGVGNDPTRQLNGSSTSQLAYAFQRAPSFFDEVCYTGTGSARTVTHNLSAVPELMIVKIRSTTANWAVYDQTSGATKAMLLNTTIAATADSAIWNNTAPTSSVFTVGTSSSTNTSAATYVAYLFATCAGVSKVGSYTGTGALLTVNCGFTSGARFVLIKRTDSTGDWYVYDSARGITASNDPYLLMNSTAAEVTGTNYVDTDTTGFKVTAAAPAGLNASGGTYIFLAIA
jgi:hypothetical protein